MVNCMVEQELNDLFHALSDATRRGMLRKLVAQPSTITELAAPYLMSFAAASKHVQVLERAKLIRRTISGRSHICEIVPEVLAEAEIHLRSYKQSRLNPE
jgi:DNA-binding transcriptional ArsR family regulator